MPHSESELTLPCPDCRGTVVPVEVTMQSGERTLKYVCNNCQKTWTVTNHEFPLSAIDAK